MSSRPLSTAIAVAMLVLLSQAVPAQTPPAPAPAETPPPAAQPAPPVVAPAPPPAAQSPVPAQPGAVQAADPFGEETTLAPKTIVFMKGNATWDTAFETLLDAYKSVYAYLDKQGLKASGPAMTVYTATDDTGFQYQAAVPLAEAPKDPPRGDISVGTSPAGKALKFVHRGSYDAMDTTYEAITNYLDEKRLEANDMFVEEYVTDPLKTPEDQLIVNVYVPVK